MIPRKTAEIIPEAMPAISPVDKLVVFMSLADRYFL
jgi:hypothetical protein